MNSAEGRLVQKIATAMKPMGLQGLLRLGLGDDAALWSPRPGYETVLTCDWFLEGSHFLSGKHPPDSVGWKCLARAVSDIAAMGGQPRCFLLSLALPRTHTRRWRSEEHTSELQSHLNLVCRLLLEKKKKVNKNLHTSL